MKWAREVACALDGIHSQEVAYFLPVQWACILVRKVKSKVAILIFQEALFSCLHKTVLLSRQKIFCNYAQNAMSLILTMFSNGHSVPFSSWIFRVRCSVPSVESGCKKSGFRPPTQFEFSKGFSSRFFTNRNSRAQLNMSKWLKKVTNFFIPTLFRPLSNAHQNR